MRSFWAIILKEWSEHRWSLVIQCGFCLLCFALVFYKYEEAKYFSQGSFSLAFKGWPFFAVIVANFLAFQLYTLESQSRTSQFLAGLPIPRWHLLLSKVAFSWMALMLVCLVYFVCIAAVSPQAHLKSWQTIVYPLVRLSAFNWFVVTLFFLVSMIGKYRWYFYLVIMAVLTYLKASGTATISFLKVLPALRLVEEERALRDLLVLPWDLIIHTVGIGCIAVVGILLVDRIVQGVRLGGYFSGLSTVSDRMVVTLVILCIPALFGTFWVSINKTPVWLDLEYHLAFEVDHQARSGSTVVELSYYKISPEDESEEAVDQQMIVEIAGLLEGVRRRLDPRWWPERWVVVKSPDVKKVSADWTKQVSGDAVVFVANWDSREVKKKRTDVVFARSQVAHFLDSIMISNRHRERHSWVTAGLARALIVSVTEEPLQKKEDVELLSDNTLERWPYLVKNSKNREIFSSGILTEIEKQLGEEEFNSWIREVGRMSLAKPEVNTLFSLKRGAFYWGGLLQDSVSALELRGFDSGPVVKAMQHQISDEE